MYDVYEENGDGDEDADENNGYGEEGDGTSVHDDEEGEHSGRIHVSRCDRGRTNVIAKKKIKRVGCEAQICARKDKEDYWMVTTVNAAHNHEMDLDMSKFMAGHRTITYAQKRHLENVDISGVPVCKNIRWLQFQFGGLGNTSCSDRDCRTFIDQMRRLRLGDGDAAAIAKLFNTLKKKDPSFHHMMDIDDDMMLRNVMWIHPRSKAAYEEFYDVVNFDTTYLVNRYNMSFATVVGINHHHQSILLGCALLTHEQFESFKWFFSNWLDAMGGVAPTAILTDQCESIKDALKEVMPETIHRFCIWHILYKFPEKFKAMKEYNKAATTLKNIIYDSLSIGEFEGKWAEFLVEYGLENNNWLQDLYAVRKSWVPIYLTHIFWAGMRSTQRSESMHAFFDSYINSRSTLKSFVEQHKIAITNKTHKELEADFKSKSTYITQQTRFEWEDQFGRVYTNNVFELFQKEIDKRVCCNLTVVDRSLSDMLNGIESYSFMKKHLHEGRQVIH
ncbi:protein FAR-RED IMPAIRED RESPONSE 1-like [Salvia miltiorrhiza]|uniref:protein FAR-RED IMPAIRED RESPONSE 1-like n=1 Tax=Salvia miltiorrhiza TaxID=226208 RepID=UPI0025AB7EA3|nr:protein FAR-RED IMPAIRED RESPONSE 1-like [Salvia miltiorrhiza]